jgi:flagellar hook-associated protein 1 FlgK
MSALFSYYDLGLRALNAARAGLQVAGDNIANASTPGYARRRVELASGHPVRVTGGMLDAGVEIVRIRRFEDRFLQATLERERGTLDHSRERLRGLQEIETAFGTLGSEGLSSAYSGFSTAFAGLAAQPESLALRRTAISAADTLARQMRDAYGRLAAQRRSEDAAVEQEVAEIDRLAAQLAELNLRIAQEEADRTTAAPLRDERQTVIEALVEHTGGSPAAAENGKVTFALPGGTTLVTAERARPLVATRDASGFLRLAGPDGTDVTDRLRGGKLGALLALRDESLPARLGELDALAADLIERANALTAAASDLDGNPGQPLFVPDPPPAAGAARTIALSAAIVADPRLLAISADGEPGDGSVATEISALATSGSTRLGGRAPSAFLSEMAASIGGEVVQADVTSAVAQGLVDSLVARRDAVSAVSLDEEAVDLMRYQRAFEAAARFMQVLNEVSEIAVNLR